MSLAYPTSLPVDELADMLSILKGQVPEASKVVKTSWVVSGFVAGKIFPDGLMPVGGLPSYESLPTAIEAIETVLASGDGEAIQALPIFVWLAIAKAAASLIQKYLLS